MKAEMLQNIQDYDAVIAALARGEEELLPSQMVDALLAGESPLKVWREHRQLTRQHVARDAGISAAYLSQIESGKRSGSTEVLTAIAKVLGVTLDDLVIRPGSESVNTSLQER